MKNLIFANQVAHSAINNQNLLRRTSDTGEQWSALEKWMASGEARVLDSMFAITRNGQRVRVDNIHELYYPTRRVENPRLVPEFVRRQRPASAGLF